jgi:hypothetical protein
MKPNWSSTIAIALLASLVRLAAPGPVADIAAVAYLFTATLAFDRRGRIGSATAQLTRRPKESFQP